MKEGPDASGIRGINWGKDVFLPLHRHPGRAPRDPGPVSRGESWLSPEPQPMGLGSPVPALALLGRD